MYCFYKFMTIYESRKYEKTILILGFYFVYILFTFL